MRTTYVTDTRRSFRLARLGVTLLECLCVFAILAVVFGLLLCAGQKVRQRAALLKCSSQLKQIGIALHLHHQTHGKLPAGTTAPQTSVTTNPLGGQIFHSMPFLVSILPAIDENLYREAIHDHSIDPTGVDSQVHRLLYTKVALYVCPADDPNRKANAMFSDFGPTSYLGVSGLNSFRRDGLLYQQSAHSFGDIRDGLSNTLLIGERPHSFDFDYPRGIWYGGRPIGIQGGSANSFLGVREDGVLSMVSHPSQTSLDCPDGPYRFQPGSFRNPCSAFHFWSLHPGGANFVFADGSVRFLPYSAADILPALASRAGGEVVSVDW